MRAKCPKCHAVFEVKLSLSLVHVGPLRWTKCPACGKSALMNNFVSEPISWPPEDAEQDADPRPTGEASKREPTEDSKSEQ